MVNGSLPAAGGADCRAHGMCKKPWQQCLRGRREHRQRPASGAFVQILGKLYFFKLGENLRIILLDYGQKRSCIANAAFKGGC
jgi:hypothetical protein